MFALASTKHRHGHDCKPVRSIMIALGDSRMQQRNDALVMINMVIAVAGGCTGHGWGNIKVGNEWARWNKATSSPQINWRE